VAGIRYQMSLAERAIAAIAWCPADSPETRGLPTRPGEALDIATLAQGISWPTGVVVYANA